MEFGSEPASVMEFGINQTPVVDLPLTYYRLPDSWLVNRDVMQLNIHRESKKGVYLVAWRHG